MPAVTDKFSGQPDLRPRDSTSANHECRSANPRPSSKTREPNFRTPTAAGNTNQTHIGPERARPAGGNGMMRPSAGLEQGHGRQSCLLPKAHHHGERHICARGQNRSPTHPHVITHRQSAWRQGVARRAGIRRGHPFVAGRKRRSPASPAEFRTDGDRGAEPFSRRARPASFLIEGFNNMTRGRIIFSPAHEHQGYGADVRLSPPFPRRMASESLFAGSSSTPPRTRARSFESDRAPHRRLIQAIVLRVDTNSIPPSIGEPN